MDSSKRDEQQFQQSSQKEHLEQISLLIFFFHVMLCRIEHYQKKITSLYLVRCKWPSLVWYPEGHTFVPLVVPKKKTNILKNTLVFLWLRGRALC